MPFVVALTGGIGSGKSSVAEAFAQHGIEVVDTDAIAHALTGSGAPGTRAIAAAFGNDFVDAAGALDRAKMRSLVFRDVAARRSLEAILHPMIRAAARDAVARARSPYVVLVVPLLVETGAYRDTADRVLVVDCAEEIQVERVMRRSGLPREEVQAIMASQASRAERMRHADDVVANDGSRAELDAAVARLDALYRDLARAQAAALSPARQTP